MYNRYGPKEEYLPIEEPEYQGGAREPRSPLPLLQRLLKNEKNAGITGILEKLGISQLDHGDILLLLVLIYLFRESEDEEWLIILALVLLMGLG